MYSEKTEKTFENWFQNTELKPTNYDVLVLTFNNKNN